MANKKELQALITLAGKVDPSLQNALKKAQGLTTKTSGTMNTLAKSTNKFVGKVVKSAATVGLGVAVAFSAVAKEGIKLASDLKEVQNVVDVSFGKSAEEINKWSETALKSYGLSELSAKQYTGTMGAMLKSSGLAGQAVVTMSEGLTGLTGDFASFYNLDAEEAFTKIRAGISGETEPLKQLGINMSVANLEAFALSKGIKTSYQKMNQASQVALRYSYLMEKSKDAQGDFARTQGTFANQTKLLKTNFQQLVGRIMTSVLPSLAGLAQKVNNMISSLANNPEKMKQIQDSIVTLADSIIRFGTDALPKIISFGKFIMDNWPEVKGLIIGVGTAFALWKVGETAYGAYKAVKLLSEGFSLVSLKLWSASSAYGVYFGWKVKDMAETIAIQALYAKDAIVMGAKTVAMWAMTAATTGWTAVTTVATAVGTAFGAVLAFITSPIGLVIIGIAALVAGIVWLYKNWDMVTKFLVSAWQNNVLPIFQGVVQWFANLWEGIMGVIKGYLNIYVNIFNFLIKGLNKINFKVPDWVPLLGGKQIGINIPLIPTFAKGGFSNVPSIFGEAGPEAAIPIKYKNPRSLSLLNQTARAIGAKGTDGGAKYIFNFSPVVSGSGSSEIKKMLEDEYQKFKDMMEQFMEEKARESFA